MFSAPKTELWHVGITRTPLRAFAHGASLDPQAITWLPDPGPFRFIADPFCLWHEEKLWVFVEALDYRVKRGEIHYYAYDAQLNLHGQGVALSAFHHLSYPTLLRADGEIYMLPEAHQSGKLTLYRAHLFPDRWEPVQILIDQPVIDPSVTYYENRWWMFFTLPPVIRKSNARSLHIAYADALTGPWHMHPMNPVRTLVDSSRPGGQPFIYEGQIYLPVQDCTKHYGQALNLLRIDQLRVNDFSCTLVKHFSAHGLHPLYADGIHTLSGDGPFSVVDAKHILRSHGRRWVNLQRKLRRLVDYTPVPRAFA